MGRILVTGADGFTGRHFINAMRNSGHDIFGLTHREQGAALAIRTYSASLNDVAKIEQIIDDVRPSHVVHLAAIAAVDHGNIGEIYATNIVGTRNLLQSLVNGDTTPDAILLASSANVYGNQAEGIIDEGAVPDPANDYAVSKLAMEHLARIFSQKLPIIIARPFNYTGVGQSSSYIIPKIVDHFRRRTPMIELGNTEVARDFSDVRAVADVYRRLIMAPNAVGQVLNVCSGTAHSLRKVLQLMEDMSGHSMDVRVNPSFVRDNEVRMLCGSRSRLEHTIGQINMPTLSETLHWMLQS